MPESHAAPSLTVLGGPLNGQSLSLQGPEMDFVLVGSDPTCQFSLPVPGVGPVHARLKRGPAGFVVQDARSERGTWVNDERVTHESALRDGDVLWLGPPGDPGSVMVSFRVEKPAPPQGRAVPPDPAPAPPPAAPAPAAQPPADVDFLIDEAAAAGPGPGPEDVPADEFLIAPDAGIGPEPGGPPASAGDVFLMDDRSPMPEADDEAFFVADTPPEPPPVDAPGPDEFFLAESEPGLAAASPFEPAFVPEFEAPPPSIPPAPAAPPEPPPPVPVATPAPAAPAPKAAALPAVPPRPSATGPRPTAPTAPARTPRPPEKPAPAGRAARSEARPPRERRPQGAAPARAGRGGGSSLRLAGLAALGLLAVGGGAFLVLRRSGAPHVETSSPARVRPGQTVALQGQGFASTPQGSTVRFGEKTAVVVAATPTRLDVEVPQLPLLPGRDAQFPVTVQVGSGVSAPLSIAVYQAPRIDGISPDVAMPGEEVDLAGGGWATSGVVVRFGAGPAEIVSVSPRVLRVRVPALPSPAGTSVPVVISVGADESNPAPFTIGRLPLISKVDPASARPGDSVTLGGRGFQAQPEANTVRIGGARAFVTSASESELKISVPWLGPPGDVPLEVRVPGSENVARATLAVAAPASDVADFRFSVEFLDEGADQALLATEIGPAFVLSASGGRSAGQRALEAAGRLNAAAVAIKASLDANFQTRNLDTNPVVGLVGQTEPVLQATAEDAATYSRLARGTPVTPARLAVWWNAVARDLVAILIRSDKPQDALALAPEGRAFVDVYQAARKTGRFGVPHGLVAEARPPFRDVLKTVALRVPVSVKDPNPGGGSVPGAAQDLRLDGTWRGTETIRGERNYLTLTFKAGGGQMAFGGAGSVSVDLAAVEQQKNVVRYNLALNGMRYYSGSWDGHKITGKVFSEPGERGEIGTFELAPVG